MASNSSDGFPVKVWPPCSAHGSLVGEWPPVTEWSPLNERPPAVAGKSPEGRELTVVGPPKSESSVCEWPSTVGYIKWGQSLV